jgi:hypothetical protein
MNGKLNKESTFGEIEKWFKENAEILPTTLDGECKWYGNLKSTIDIHIKQVYVEIDRLGIEAVKKKRSALANASKGNLYTMYVDLQKVENWNAPRPNLNSLNQRI